MKIYLRHTRDEKVMNLVKISTNQHAIFTSDAFEMENTIRMRTLEDEIAMNSIQLFRNYMKSFNEMYL